MRRSCKHINIRDPKTVYPWVRECIDRHKERDDFRRLLINVGGMDPAEYYRAMRENLDEPFDGPSMRIAIAATQGISRRDLRLSRPRIKERVDGSSGKLRKIGRESAMQQVYDHIADKSWPGPTISETKSRRTTGRPGGRPPMDSGTPSGCGTM